MKQKLLLKAMLLLCALIAGSSSVWADDSYTITFANSANGATGITSSTQASTTIAEDSRTYVTTQPYTINSGNCYYGDTQSCIRIGKSGNASSLSIALSNNGKVSATTIVVHCNNTGGNNNSSATLSVNGKTAQTTTTTAADYTFNINANIESITLAGSASIRIYSITVNYATTPAGTTAAPTISGDTPFLNETTVTIDNAASAEGADIYYTLNGDAPTTTTSATCFAYSAPFTIDATTTVKAIAKKSTDTNASSVVSKTFTKATLLTVADARSAIDGDAMHDIDFVKGIIAKIGTLNNNGQLTYWISDDGSMTNNIQCNLGKNVGGAAFEATTDLEVGDIAIVKGHLSKSSNTYLLDANNEVVSITHRTKVNILSFTATTNPLVLGGTTTTGTTVTNDQAGWTPVSYIYESTDETVATVNASGDISAFKKGTATITVKPNVSASDPTYKVGESKSIEIVVQNQSHTAYFSVNGTINPDYTVLVEEGESITLPTPSSIGNKAFVGWVASPIEGTTNTAPSFVTSATMSTADVTYYAVYASGTATPGWKKLAASEVSEAGTYALLTTDGHAFNGNISSGHGQATTDAFSFVNNVATSAPAGTCEITLQAVTGGYKMYNADNGYLYAKAANTKNLAWHDSESSYWSYESLNWKYNSNSAYLRSYENGSFRTYGSNNGDVLVFAQKTMIASYSGYCTTFIPEPSDPVASGETISLTTTESMAGWRTFYDADQAYTVDENTKIYVVKAKTATANVVELTALEATAIPAAAPVILKTSASNRTMVLTKADNADALGDNLLTVTDGTNDADGYRLGYREDTGVAFFQYQATKPAAGIVYIAATNVTTNVPGAPAYITIGGEATGVNDARSKTEEARGEYFNLAGQRVAQPTKGLYIVNGRKVVVK